ncbi:MAG: protease-4 [Lentisphaeria bacterium]|jgi:protease-4
MLNYLAKFWKFVTAVRTSLMNVLFLLAVAFIIIVIVAPGPAPLPRNAPLYIPISGVLVDQLTHQASPLDLLEPNAEDHETLLRDIITALNEAASDVRITAAVFQLSGMQGGNFSKLEEIGQAIENFKRSGKTVIAYSDSYSQQQYFLASYADTIYINKLGTVGITGFARFGNYFKEALDKLSIKFHVFRVGDYKDAVEPFIRNNMSVASREHNAGWINELWGRYTSKVETSRGLPTGAIESFIESLEQKLKKNKESHAQLFKNAGLVDEIISRAELNRLLIKTYGKDKDTDYFKAINYQRFLANIAPTLPSTDDNIGLIVASGNIIDGHAPKGEIGSESLSELIRQAANDESLKALIIRVDSGGGSAFASEVIRDEIASATSRGLPVYISMSSVAASGGYWISAAADEIWASPSTITGSIGVFGLMPNFSEAFNRLGIYSDGIGTTPLSDIYNLDRPISEPAKQVIQSSVDNIYREFLSLVATSRHKSSEDIHTIAQGRVWTGETALELGLVDRLGSLNDLIDAIVEQEKLSKTSVKLIERPLSTSEQLMLALLEEVSVFGDAVKVAFWGESLMNLQRLASSRFPSAGLIPHQSGGDYGSPTIFTNCLECVAP